MSPDQETTIELAAMFKLVSDPSRLRILLSCLDVSKPVSVIALELGMSVPLVSHHLRLLKSARLVRAERAGRQIFYIAADHHVSGMLSDMVAHAEEKSAMRLDRRAG